MKNPILHIVRKDIRQHWPEIAASFVITVTYAWHEAARPITSGYVWGGFFSSGPWLPLLVVVGWGFMVLRAVHAECLVGDRQFWVTRPYEWRKLLGAKWLFVVLFVNLPLLILQVFLLLRAGFSPTAHFAALLELQVEWALFVVLPIAAVASVTAGIGQFLLAVLVLVVYLQIVIAAIFKLVPAAEVSGVSSVPGSVEVATALGTSLAVVLWQYARRRTVPARILLLGAAAVVSAVMFATPYRTLIRRAYPAVAPGQSLPVQLAFDPAKPVSLAGGYPEENKVHLRIPILVSGIAERSMVRVAGTNVSVQGSGAQHWSSGWRGNGTILLPGRQHDQLLVTVGRDFFQRVESIPVSMRISFALASARATQTVRTVVQAEGFAAPGEGRCSVSPIDPGGLVCVFPIETPFLLVSAKSNETTCAPRPGETPLPSGAVGYGWVGAPIAGGGEFGISPVHAKMLDLWNWKQVGPRRFPVCPGTPLTILANWEGLARARVDLDINGIRLADYKLNDTPGGGPGFGISVP